jgi:hypothetical protein
MSTSKPTVTKKVAGASKKDVVAVAVVEAPAAVKVVSVPAKKASKKDVVAVAVPVVVEAAPVVTAQAIVADATPVEEVSWQVELKSLQDELMKIRDAAASAIAASKRLEKRVSREMRDARKNRRKPKAPLAEGEERKPSIFQIPVPITDDLSIFLGGPKGNLMSRSQVTKAIMAYIKENKLNDKHKINPNAALRALLSIKEGDELTIFNMQSYLQKHYVKATATA